MLVPSVMNIVPILVIWRNVGLYNTISGLWLAIMAGAVTISVWVLRDNFQKLPPNAEECAQVYGCSQFSAFVQVILPLANPAILAVAFLNFLQGWTEFLTSNVITTSNGPRPAIVVLFHLLSPDKTVPWPYIMAATFIIAIPPAVLYIIERRYLEDALSF